MSLKIKRELEAALKFASEKEEIETTRNILKKQDNEHWRTRYWARAISKVCHKKVKEIADSYKRQHATVLRDKYNNKIITRLDTKLKRWHEHIEQLPNDERTHLPLSLHNIVDEKGSKIYKYEIKRHNIRKT